MSNLRIFGIIISAIGLILCFIIYRGPNWKKGNFLFFFIFSLSLFTVSLNPNVVNILAEMLALKEDQRGRVVALLIISNIALWLLVIYYRYKFDNTKQQFDFLIRKLGAREWFLDSSEKINPIMILIPAYEEAENLRILLKRIPSSINGIKVGILVIDDGSSDDTTNVVKESGFLVARNIINRGQGAASRLGYDLLLKEKVDIVVTMDADNQHSPDDIEKLVIPIMEGRYDLVIGSRIVGTHEEYDLVRSLGIRVFTRIINILTGLKLTDCSSGFKAFNAEKMKRIKLLEDQFQSSEVIIESAKQGLRIGEVAITMKKREKGVSKKGTNFNYGLEFFKTIIKTWWR